LKVTLSASTAGEPDQVFEYRGFAYKQAQNADEVPWILSFVVPAEELTEWAGIPRRSEQNLVGFQRAVDPVRVDKARDFFQTPNNQSPTALVVGFHPSSATEDGPVSLQLEGAESDGIRPFVLRIDMTEYRARELEWAVEAVKRDLTSRLDETVDADGDVDGTAGTSAEEDNETDSEVDDAEGAGVEEDDDEIDVEGDEGFELGRSIISALLERLEDADWVEANSEALLDMAKPGTVIDGQHRLKGAEACERDIPFAVCALWDCAWPEQVFQFTVVNYTAKGIPDQFITANAALSLTSPELAQLQQRLVQADVKVVEYELMRTVQFDPRSPFYNLVNLAERKTEGKIGYKTMVRIAKRWYQAKHQVFKLLLQNLYPDIKGVGSLSRRRERWREGDWSEFFLDFWSIIHSAYKDESSHVQGKTLWDVGNSQLLVAIVLYEYQEAFLNNLNAQDEEFFEVDDETETLDELRKKLRRRAEKFVTYLPADFFATEWEMKSLSTGPGRDALEAAFRDLVDQKGKAQYASSRLVTG
jgi:hypothetical protein